MTFAFEIEILPVALSYEIFVLGITPPITLVVALFKDTVLLEIVIPVPCDNFC